MSLGLLVVTSVVTGHDDATYDMDSNAQRQPRHEATNTAAAQQQQTHGDIGPGIASSECTRGLSHYSLEHVGLCIHHSCSSCRKA